MRVMAQMAMVMNLDKCIGCHTCSVTCKQAWTNRTGTEYVWFNNVETRPGLGYPAPTRTRDLAGRLGPKSTAGWPALKAGGRKKLLSSSPTPSCPRSTTTTSPGPDYETCSTHPSPTPSPWRGPSH